MMNLATTVVVLATAVTVVAVVLIARVVVLIATQMLVYRHMISIGFSKNRSVDSLP